MGLPAHPHAQSSSCPRLRTCPPSNSCARGRSRGLTQGKCVGWGVCWKGLLPSLSCGWGVSVSTSPANPRTSAPPGPHPLTHAQGCCCRTPPHPTHSSAHPFSSPSAPQPQQHSLHFPTHVQGMSRLMGLPSCLNLHVVAFLHAPMRQNLRGDREGRTATVAALLQEGLRGACADGLKRALEGEHAL